MYKLIFCDKNKSLVKKVDLLFKEFKENKWGLELEAIHGNIFKVQKDKGGKIVTASNPQFTFGGGLDAQIKMNFPNECINNKEFEITKNLFKVISVDSNIKCNKKILERALIGVFGYRSNKLIINGLGTSIGGLLEDDFLEILKKVLYADLRYADLSYANLSSADLRSADLSHADLRSANLSYADLRHANLSSANLSHADLRSANLRYANLSSANLSHADLRSAKNIESILLNELTCFISSQCPEEGEFIAFKKCINNTIVKLLIPKDAKRSSATSRKCRASKAKVIAIYSQEGKELKETVSSFDKEFIYKVGKIVEPKNGFEENRFIECGGGIHFFITRQEAEQYN